MNRKARTRFEARARIVKALAHPTRLFLVDELSRGTRCVCELQRMVGDDMSTVSKHLSILRGAGIVTVEKRGTQVHYSHRVPCIMKFFGCVEAGLTSVAAEQRKAID